MQNPEAVEVKGFHTRKKEWRMVKKWEKALYVFAMKKGEKINKKTGEKEEKTYFWIKPVFDVNQTEPFKL